MMKHSSLNGGRTGTGDGEPRKHNITTFSTVSQSNKAGASSVKNGGGSIDSRNPPKPVSKRRANSNSNNDKKVNLDKFLSVVQ